MMRLPLNPAAFALEVFETGCEATMLAVESNVVVAYRTSRLCGFRAPRGGELTRMLTEKPPAFAASALAAGATAFGGQRPDRVMAAALRPLRAETNRNVRRLGRTDAPS